MISSGNKSKIISSGHNSNVHFLNNSVIPYFYNEVTNNDPRYKPGDMATCPDGFEVPVDKYGNYYCNIDPNGDGLYPFTDVDCGKENTSIINVNGNIENNCKPIVGSYVTCYAGFTAVVENNGTWDCSQGENTRLLLDYYSGFNGGGIIIEFNSIYIPENTIIDSFFIGRNAVIYHTININGSQSNSIVTDQFLNDRLYVQQVGNQQDRDMADIEIEYMPDAEESFAGVLNGYYFLVFLYKIVDGTTFQSVENYKINLDGISFANLKTRTFLKNIYNNTKIKDGLFAASIILGNDINMPHIRLRGRVHDQPSGNIKAYKFNISTLYLDKEDVSLTIYRLNFNTLEYEPTYLNPESEFTLDLNSRGPNLVNSYAKFDIRIHNPPPRCRRILYFANLRYNINRCGDSFLTIILTDNDNSDNVKLESGIYEISASLAI